MSCRARRSEALIKKELVLADLPSYLLQHDCRESRAPCGGCPNALKCRNEFVALSDVIKRFRTTLCAGNEKRKKQLFCLLTAGCHENGDGEKEITFTIAGKSVCKSFYRDATGFRRQLFDECVLEVLGLVTKPLGRRVQRQLPLETRSRVVAILDLIFTELSVKQDPTRRNHKISCRCTWAEIYEKDFKKYAGPGFICSLKQFNRIRREERKNYRKSPRMTKGKHNLT